MNEPDLWVGTRMTVTGCSEPANPAQETHMAYRKPDHPENRQEKVKAWFMANPGPHAARTVAEALGLEPQPVAMDCTRLWRKGVLLRTVRTKAGNTRGITSYEIAP